MMYNKLVETCFFNPRHVGILDLTENLSAFYRGGEAGRGDVFDFYLLCDEKGNILKARFKAYGNPYFIAAAEWLCRQLEGSQIDEHPCFDYAYLLQKLEIPKARYPVALLIEDGYRELVQIMKQKLKRGD
ncbi:MAG: iron-sulfur cluster assembly scaffold protein [Tatlockia sp.]|nr:iron-sulfur cluster assembly scaffold protein [Tatlockia sp.]